MSSFVNISLAVCNSAYICYLAVLYCECELVNCCVAVRSNCLFKTVLTVLKAFKLGTVALECNRLVVSCKCLCLFAFANCYAFKCLALFLNCEYEGSLAC